MLTKTQQLATGNFEGMHTKLLFVCTAGILRSPTAAAIAQTYGYNTRSCGSDLDYALIPVSDKLIRWADVVVFVNSFNASSTYNSFFGDVETQLLILDKQIIWLIEDDYEYMQPELVEIVENYMPALENTLLRRKL